MTGYAIRPFLAFNLHRNSLFWDSFVIADLNPCTVCESILLLQVFFYICYSLVASKGHSTTVNTDYG